MESRAKILGHPIHPMLIVFPLGLFIASVIFDVLYLLTNNPTFASVAYWNIAGGVIGGLLASVAGLVDYLAIPDRTRAKAIGLWHGLGNLGVIALFAVSWLLRNDEAGPVVDTLPFILSLAGVGLSALTGWLGGELVDRLGVGVDPGANLDSPSSLSGKPADANLEGARATAGSPVSHQVSEREREVGSS